MFAYASYSALFYSASLYRVNNIYLPLLLIFCSTVGLKFGEFSLQGRIGTMETITVTSAKGGVGKTTTAISIATSLKEYGDKVLLIDTDPQSAATKHFPGGDYDWERTIRQVMLGEANLTDVIYSPIPDISFVASQLRLQNIEKELADENNPLFILHDALQTISSEYDYCIIDTAPNQGLMTRSALTVSDYVVLPTQLEAWPIEALDISFEEIEKAKQSQKYIGREIKKVLVLPTFYEERRQISTAFHFALRQGYTEILSETVIHRSVDVSKTYSTPLDQLDADSRAYDEYMNFTRELLRRE